MSQCEFGPDIPVHEARKFLPEFLPHEDFMVVKQTNIGYIKDPA